MYNVHLCTVYICTIIIKRKEANSLAIYSSWTGRQCITGDVSRYMYCTFIPKSVGERVGAYDIFPYLESDLFRPWSCLELPGCIQAISHLTLYGSTHTPRTHHHTIPHTPRTPSQNSHEHPHTPIRHTHTNTNAHTPRPLSHTDIHTIAYPSWRSITHTPRTLSLSHKHPTKHHSHTHTHIPNAFKSHTT
jgi:hypothetical protein